MKALIPAMIVSLAGTFAAADARTTIEPKAGPDGAAVMDAASEACRVAIPGYEQAVSANPSDAVAQARLGVCYQRTGQVERAINAYRASLEVDSKQAVTWNNLGAAYHGLDDLNRAVKYYRKAVHIDPQMARAYKNLGTALIARGNIQDGFEALGRAFSLSPEVFDQSGSVTAGMSAERLAQQYLYLAKLSASAGDVDTALAFLGRAREVGYDDVASVRNDPAFAKVKSDDRFAALDW